MIESKLKVKNANSGQLFRKFKVALKLLDRIFLTLQKVASQHADHYLIIKNGGHRACF